ncbi:hypothetical protein SUGI_1056490 [Cryptomeria japonica]|uniref:inactive TPR repeat-containing thioredoxin TTL3 n=1 Tax=Cryptomeria japonica TaxID=3369 RepID=UPI002414704F|nr:inactive TPR repeat-containing thioredoxin TTL3 [Cryptomeria japonica]GLJ49758.1 hypothetical protein SUGI_1056490 [Cryptomeria japonica]
MQAQMAYFPPETKKRGGFDLYGGVFNSRIFGSFRDSNGNADRSKNNNNGGSSPSFYSFSKNGDGDKQRQMPVGETKNIMKAEEIHKMANAGGGIADSGKEMEMNLKEAQHGDANNVNLKGSIHKIGADSGRVDMDSKKQDAEFSDNSVSSMSVSSSLGRKSSDASSCSSCGSVSGIVNMVVSPGREMVKLGGNRSHSGELSSGGSSSGGSPTVESSGRRSCSSVGNILGNGPARKSYSAPLGNLKHHGSRATKSDCYPPSLKSGYSSSSSGELTSHSNNSNGNGNVSHIGNVLSSGNILSNGKPKPNAATNNGKGIPRGTSDHVPSQYVLRSGNANYGHGSIIKGNGVTGNIQIAGENIMLKRVLASTDPEVVKNGGNDQYHKGHFSEALFLYERAIALSPGHALYHSNKSAALTGLGRLQEAVQECLEAIKLDPSYVRAHQKLATLYLRLGEIENAKTHLKIAGQLPDWSELQTVQAVEVYLTKCAEARKIGDWRSLLRESTAAIMAGADSAPQLYASKAEALLKIQRLDEADGVLMAAPKIVVDASARFYGIVGNSYLLLVQAQVDMALGRFESAVTNAERAARMDLYNHEVTALLRKARSVADARKNGNALFKACKYFEACTAYGEGLEHDPMNAILLCNRATCRSKLGQWEKAVEDCNAALSIKPTYYKALHRRADSNAKLERWEDSMRDYEALRREVPGDIDVARALFDVQVNLKKSRGEEINNMKFGGEVEVVSSDDQFRQAITAPGLAVVHFSSRSNERCKQISPFVDHLCKRYPSVNFLKVDVQDNLFLAKSENVNCVPTFKIYKNGFKVKEIIGPSQQMLESSVNHYSL